jgi:hypothetical protein
MTQLRQSRNRLDAFRRYLLVIAIGNLVWEAVQLPLYTIWVEGSWSQIGFAWVHCTLGDVLIGAAALLGALMLCRMPKWPMGARGRVAAVAMILAVIYTIFSEWLNVEVRHSWAMDRCAASGTSVCPKHRRKSLRFPALRVLRVVVHQDGEQAQRRRKHRERHRPASGLGPIAPTSLVPVD